MLPTKKAKDDRVQLGEWDKELDYTFRRTGYPVLIYQEADVRSDE